MMYFIASLFDMKIKNKNRDKMNRIKTNKIITRLFTAMFIFELFQGFY